MNLKNAEKCFGGGVIESRGGICRIDEFYRMF